MKDLGPYQQPYEVKIKATKRWPRWAWTEVQAVNMSLFIGWQVIQSNLDTRLRVAAKRLLYENWSDRRQSLPRELPSPLSLKSLFFETLKYSNWQRDLVGTWDPVKFIRLYSASGSFFFSFFFFGVNGGECNLSFHNTKHILRIKE